MSAVEIATIVGCLILGYWIMAVFIPALMDKETYSENPANEAREDSPQAEDAGTDTEFLNEAPWHQILDVAENATYDQISTAYKRKIREYHPDRVAQMGHEIRNLAELKSRQINAAYQHATRLRGRGR